MTETNPKDGRELLASMLRHAASFEPRLLANHIFVACSIKSAPQEFSKIERNNCCRAAQFESAPRWKEPLLNIAVHKMRHLHLVQCMLKVLSERPCFELPNGDERAVRATRQARLS